MKNAFQVMEFSVQWEAVSELTEGMKINQSVTNKRLRGMVTPEEPLMDRHFLFGTFTLFCFGDIVFTWGAKRREGLSNVTMTSQNSS